MEVKRRIWKFLGHILKITEIITVPVSTHLDSYGQQESQTCQNNLMPCHGDGEGSGGSPSRKQEVWPRMGK